MSRPGFVLEVDERTPPLLMPPGRGLPPRAPAARQQGHLPAGLAARRPQRRRRDRATRCSTRWASSRCASCSTPGMRADHRLRRPVVPAAAYATPDVRQRVIEHVLELAAAKGVDDVELIAGNSLHRRMTPAELKRIVGERVFRSFFPDHLRNHDAEDSANLLDLGTTDHGEVVEINRRAAESDLVVYVNITLTAMSGGPKSVSVGLASYRSLRHHHNVQTLRHSRSFNDPPNSAMHHSYDRMDGPDRRSRHRLPDRDDAQQRHVPGVDRLPEQA